MQTTLFPAPIATRALPRGFTLLRDYVDERTESELLAHVDAGAWDADWKRRVQIYGLGYGGDAGGSVDGAARVGDLRQRAASGSAGGFVWVRDLPDWIAPMARRLVDDGHLERFPENLVINDYAPGVGIGAHRDYPAFHQPIAALSLASDTVIELAPAVDDAGKRERRVSVHVPRRSLWVMRDEARTHWTHAIAHRLHDVVDGAKVRRGRRVSITFRTASAKLRARVPPSAPLR